MAAVIIKIAPKICFKLNDSLKTILDKNSALGVIA
jgi:hypothetical protein